MHESTRIRIATLLAVLALLGIAACGGGGESEAPVPEVAPKRQPTGTTGTTGTTGGEAATGRLYRIWLTRGEHLFATWRDGPVTAGVGAAALRSLLEGPTPREAEAGIASLIPAGTRLLGLDVKGGTATVDLTSEYESGGGSLSMTGRLAQVVYTITEFPTVQRVRFALDGEQVDVFSGEGIVLEQPVGRADYEELLPPILVESPPLFGRRVSSPVELHGTANVFEANVTVRILGRDGQELARTFTTATCGTGCRGDFSVRLPYRSPADQPGTVVLADDDADGDGTPAHEVRIPVLLSQS